MRTVGEVAAGAAIVFTCLSAPTTAQPESSEVAQEGWVERGSAPFVDASEAVGLDFRHFSGRTGHLYFAEMNGAGAALFDFDNDGDLDAYLVQGANLDDSAATGVAAPTDRLLRNDGVAGAGAGEGLAFTDVTAEAGFRAAGYGMGVAAGDFDNDGWTDLYVTNLGANQLLRNNRDGTFSDATVDAGVGDESWSISATFADFDRDGWLDLYVVNYVAFSLASHRICPTPSGMLDYCGPQAFAYEGDRLYRNLGNGRFEDVTVTAGLSEVRAAGMGVVAADFDSDGWVDFYVANDQMENQLWMNQGDGTFLDRALLSATAFNESGAPEASMGIAAGDYDNDGDEDLLVTHLRRETNTLYRNDGSGLFSDATRASGLGPPSWSFTSFGAGWLDFDNDGWLDLLIVSGSVRILEDLAASGDAQPLRQRNQLFRGIGDTGDGGGGAGGDIGSTGGNPVRFEDITAVAGSAFERSEVSRGAAFGDVDNDGDTDVLIANNDGPARLLLNRVGQDRHWLGLRLVGERSPRDMLGAWVCLTRADSRELCRAARAGGSYASSSDPRVLFGLGAVAAGGRVRVVWPSGRAEIFTVDGFDRYVELREGTGKSEP